METEYTVVMLEIDYATHGEGKHNRLRVAWDSSIEQITIAATTESERTVIFPLTSYEAKRLALALLDRSI